MKIPRIPSSSSDKRLVELLTSEVTESKERTVHAVWLIVVWRLRWWPAGIPAGAVIWWFHR